MATPILMEQLKEAMAAQTSTSGKAPDTAPGTSDSESSSSGSAAEIPESSLVTIVL